MRIGMLCRTSSLGFILASLHATAAAASAAVFPAELRGVWEPSRPCDTAALTDRDSRFEITERQRRNYEETEDIRSAQLLTDSPLTWRIVTTSDIGPPDLAQPRIYVLQDDLLAVSDGQSARMYMRCG